MKKKNNNIVPLSCLSINIHTCNFQGIVHIKALKNKKINKLVAQYNIMEESDVYAQTLDTFLWHYTDWLKESLFDVEALK